MPQTLNLQRGKDADFSAVAGVLGRKRRWGEAAVDLSSLALRRPIYCAGFSRTCPVHSQNPQGLGFGVWGLGFRV